MKNVVFCSESPLVVPVQPIDTLGAFEQTSDRELATNIREQLEHSAAELLINYKHPDWKRLRHALVDQVMRAYIGRRLIRVSGFQVHWLDSYRIVDRPKGAAAIIYSGAEVEFCVEYQMRTGLLHAVGRDYLRQCPGMVEYKRGQYELHNHLTTFRLAGH